jgi:HK97 gp10 family phage protein
VSGAGVTIEGLDFVREQIEGFLPREAEAILRRTVTRIAATVRDDIRANAPKVTGILHRAIRSRRERGNRGEVLASVYITKGKGAKADAWYWHLVEFGSRTARAKPFIGPAVERARAGYVAALKSEVGRQVINQLEKRAKAQRGGR